MRNKKLIIGLIVIVILIFSIISSSGRSKSIEGALNLQNNSFQIIHEEKTDKGVIVFGMSFSEGKKGFFTSFLNKNIFGYKDFYSGGLVIEDNYPRDLTNNYFPAIKRTSLPIYFGLVINEEITKITVNEVGSDEVKEAKIIEDSGERIWLVYMKGFKGKEFEISGYNKNGEEVYKLKDETTWEVEKEPMKSPYK